MVTGAPARLASGPVRLKTSLTLSLALLLGAASADTLAAPRRGAPPTTRKPKQAPPTEPTPPEPVAQPPPPPPPAPEPVAPPAPVVPAAPWAGKTVVLAVPATPAAASRAAQLETQLRTELSAQPDVQVVTPEWLFDSPAPESLQQGDKLFAEGKELYDNLDPEAAARKFLEAATFYEQHPVDTKPERLARVYIFLGASHLLNEDAPHAKEAFTRALLAAPGVKPESDLFGQDVHDTFAAQQQALQAQPKGTLVVDSQPAGAQVTLRGEPLGTTPLKPLELPPGPVQLALTLPGHQPYGVFQKVPASGRQEMRPTLEPLPGLAEVHTLARRLAAPAALEAKAGPPPAEARALGEKLGARYVVLAVVGREAREPAATALYAWDVQGNSRLRGVEFAAGDEGKRQRAVAQVHDFATGRIVPRSALPPALVATVKKPWFWAAVGGVALVTTTGVLLATQGPRPLGGRLGNFGAGW
jgi:hypothetical protein